MMTTVGVAIAAVAVVVAIAVSRSQNRSGDHRPSGLLVVVQANNGGVPLVPVAGGMTSVDYLRDGTRIYIDCLQLVDPNYVQARISDGPFATRWIDALRIRTTRNEDVRDVQPRLPFCGPPVPLATTASSQ